MPTQQIQNYVQTTLASSITNVATSLTLTSAAGFPTTGNFRLVIKDVAPATTFEIVECTAIAGAVCTVTRAMEGTTGIAHTAGALIGNDITAAMLLAAFPLGTLGYVQVTAGQSGITTPVDLTSLTLTLTAGTGRRLRVSAFCFFQSTVVDDLATLTILQDGSQVSAGQTLMRPAGQPTSVFVAVVISPTAGSHVYKLQGGRAVGTGTLTMVALATVPAFLLIEDIGS